MLLSTIGRNVLCVEAGNIADALTLIAQHPDLQLCLLDLTLENEHGLGAIKRIKEAAPQVAVVVVSGSDDSDTISSCIDAGAVYLPDRIVSAMENRSAQAQLTPRQLQVLQALSRGLPNKLIAHELDLSEHTIKDHVAAVFAVLGVRNRTEAVIRASQLRLQECSATVRG